MSSVSDLDYCYNIPRIYIKNNLVDKDKEYQVNLDKLPLKEKS